jgi:hypothetical protein
MFVPLHLNKLESIPLKDNLCQVCLQMTLWLWRIKFVIGYTQFLHFCDSLPLEEDLVLYLKNKNEFPSHKENLYQVWLNLAGWFYRRVFFKFSMHFYSFAIISPWREAIPIIWTNLNSLPQGWFMSCLVKIGWVVLEKIFKWSHPNFTFLWLYPFSSGHA